MGECESARICLTSARHVADSSKLHKYQQVRPLCVKGRWADATQPVGTDMSYGNALCAVRRLSSPQVGKGEHKQESGRVGGVLSQVSFALPLWDLRQHPWPNGGICVLK